MNLKLRKQLNKIVSPENEKNWYIPELFAKNTLPKLPSELKIIESPLGYNNNYNCFLYILNLHKNIEILKESGGFIYSAFIKKLIDLGELKKVLKPAKGTIVLYENEKEFPNEFTHGGIMQDNQKVISKWSWGPIFIHDLFDVPLFYGDSVSFYEAIPKEKALKLYTKYKAHNQI